MQVRLIKILSLDTLNLKKMWGYKVANTDTNIANNANSVSLNKIGNKKYFRSGSDLGLNEVKHRGERKVVLQSIYEKMKEAGEIGKFIEGKWEICDSYNGKIHLFRDWSREQRNK